LFSEKTKAIQIRWKLVGFSQWVIAGRLSLIAVVLLMAQARVKPVLTNRSRDARMTSLPSRVIVLNG
jgi:hypothetical protein